jgi:hypothetical protein
MNAAGHSINMNAPNRPLRLASPALALVVVSTLLAPLRSPAAVVAWGDNLYGQAPPSAPPGLGAARAVAAGYWHNLAIKSDGSATAWGLSAFGQTNIPSGLGPVLAVAAGHDHSLALTASNTVVAWGDNTYHQTDVPPDLSGVTAVSAGGYHSAALRVDGTVVCWGYNFYGQTNTPPDLTNAVVVACGNSFTLALRADGTVAAWGDDFYDQTVVPAGLSNVTGIAAGFAHGLALKSDGTVVQWGDTTLGQAAPPSDLTNAATVSAGFTHSAALRNNGTVTAWGDNSAGQCNVPGGLNRVVGIAAGYAHSIALTDDRPLLTSQPVSVVTNAGFRVTFGVSASGAPPLVYRWWKLLGGPTNSMAGTSNLLVFNSVTTNNAGTYFAVVTNAYGAVTSATVTLAVNVRPTITSHPVNVVTNAGGTASFTVQATGTAPLGYRWFFNTNTLVGGNSNRLVLDAVATNNAGTYRVIVTNMAGAATSSIAVLTVLDDTPVPPSILTQPQSQSVLIGGAATFYAGAGGTMPMWYQWRFNAADIPGATNASHFIAPAQVSDAGGYSVAVTNVAGSVTSAVATLTVFQPPVITGQPASVMTNAGSRVVLAVGVTGTSPLSYRWWKRAGSTNTFAGSSNQLVFNSVTASNAGDYFVVVTNLADTATSQVATITILTKPGFVSQPSNVVTNEGATATFAASVAGSAPFAFQWWFNGTNAVGGNNAVLVLADLTTNQAGAYHLVVTNAAGGATSAVATLTVLSTNIVTPPVILTQPQNKSVLQGATANFSVVADGTGPLSYQWRFNLTNDLPDATNAALAIASAQTTNAGAYTVVITNLAGAVTSTVAVLTVAQPPFIIAHPASLTTNAGARVVFAVGAGGTAPLTYRWWRVGGTNVAGGTSNQLVLNAVSNASSGGYFAVVSNLHGTATSAVATLTVVAGPVILAQPAGVVTNTGAPATFAVQAAGGAPLSYQWWFNGTNAVGENTNVLHFPAVTTNDAGGYTVVVTNSAGAITSSVATLAVFDGALTPATLFALRHPGSNGLFLTIAFEAGKNYRIQVSTNLSDWTDLTNFLSTSTTMSFLDQAGTNAGANFYRVVSP